MYHCEAQSNQHYARNLYCHFNYISGKIPSQAISTNYVVYLCNLPKFGNGMHNSPYENRDKSTAALHYTRTTTVKFGEKSSPSEFLVASRNAPLYKSITSPTITYSCSAIPFNIQNIVDFLSGIVKIQCFIDKKRF